MTRGVRLSGCVIDPRVRKLAHRRVFAGRTETIGVVVLVAVSLILTVL